MILYVTDDKKEKDVRLILENVTVIPSSDLYVIFISEDVISSLTNNTPSTPYNKYYFKKIHHIVEATADYEGQIFSLTIGYFLDENGFTPFLIDHIGHKTEYNTFSTASMYDAAYCTSYIIFNYCEYKELKDIGLEDISFKEYIIRLLNNKQNDATDYNLYTIPTKYPNKYLIAKELNDFIAEEDRTIGKK